MPTSPRLSPDVLVPRRSGAGAGSGRRVAFYSHDTQGLGHVRRNSLLAAAMVAAHPDVNVLLLSGASEAGALPLPDRTDIVTVPGLAKDVTGRYRARELDCSLEQVLAVRSAALESVLVNFAPDLLVVDKVPRGILGELEPGLRRVRRAHGTRTVLGLRDVLDEPAVVAARAVLESALAAMREWYDRIWIYGDPVRLRHRRRVYGLDGATSPPKARFTGYLGRGRARRPPRRPRSSPAPHRPGPAPEPFVLCLVGGGQDGFELASAFAGAPLPAGVSRACSSPGRSCRARTAAGSPGSPPAAARTSSSATSSTTLLCCCWPARGRSSRWAATTPSASCSTTGSARCWCRACAPRTEQLIRGRRLAELGLLDLLLPELLHPCRVLLLALRAVP